MCAIFTVKKYSIIGCGFLCVSERNQGVNELGISMNTIILKILLDFTEFNTTDIIV